MRQDFINYLSDISKSNKEVVTTPQKLVRKYGVKRRGWRVVEAINNKLNEFELLLDKDLMSAYFYGEIRITPIPKLKSTGNYDNPKFSDPIPRISLLRSSNLNNLENEKDKLVCVKMGTKLEEAISLMMSHSFSQLPILEHNKIAKGIISWESIGKALALGKNCNIVDDCYNANVEILKLNEPLFDAVKIILKKEVVLVKDHNNHITGIVTSTDIAEQFLKLSEPFLLIEQIEFLIRQLLDEKLTFDDIDSVLDIEKYEKEIKHLSDLSFGHYVRIIENKKLFNKLETNVDRVILKKLLEKSNIIRNDVMHFSPEELTPEELDILRRTLSFLSQIVNK